MTVAHCPWAPDGPWRIGLQILGLTRGERRIQAYVWYPAQAATGASRKYLTEAEARAYDAALQRLGAVAPNSATLTALPTASVPNAPVADGRFPFVVFNHGGALGPLANFSLLETLASWGIVAASLGHAGESAALAWRDGTASLIEPSVLARMQLPPEAMAAFAHFLVADNEPARRRALNAFQTLDPGGLREISLAWAEDSIAFVDQMADPNTELGASDLCRAFDVARLAYGGMSLGGSAAYDACRRDARATAGFNLDGVNWDFDAIDHNIGKPFLALQSDPQLQKAQLAALFPEIAGQAAVVGNANDFHYVTPDRRHTSPEIVRLILAGADHMDFTDLVVLERMGTDARFDEANAKRAAIVGVTRAFLRWAFGLAPRTALDETIAATPSLSRAALLY